MSEWIPIRYGSFWDVPRELVLTWRGLPLLLDSPFREDIDDYDPEYTVFLTTHLDPARLYKGDAEGWTEARKAIVRTLGRLPVKTVQFDKHRRSAVDSKTIEAFCLRVGLEPPQGFGVAQRD